MARNFCTRLGETCLRCLRFMGSITLFFLEGMRQIFTSPKIFRRTYNQIYIIGSKSLLLIVLIGLFCGSAPSASSAPWSPWRSSASSGPCSRPSCSPAAPDRA